MMAIYLQNSSDQKKNIRIPSEVQLCESTFSRLDTEKEAKIWIVSKKWSRMNTSGIHLILLSAMSTAFLIWLAFST